MQKCLLILIPLLLTSLITTCVVPPPSPPDRNQIARMVVQAIGDWQDQRGLGVTGRVKSIVVDEYLLSLDNCRTNYGSIQRRDVEFYVFQYLDQVREIGFYSPEIICDPFAEGSERKINKYGELRIETDPGTSVYIDNELFHERFKDFLLTAGEHALSVQSRGRVICRNKVTIRGGEVTQISCLVVR